MTGRPTISYTAVRGSREATDLFNYERLGRELPCENPVEHMLSADDWFDDTENNHRAAGVCVTKCPLVDLCLAVALERQENLGVWGGKTATQRRSYRRASSRRRVIEEKMASR